MAYITLHKEAMLSDTNPFWSAWVCFLAGTRVFRMTTVQQNDATCRTPTKELIKGFARCSRLVHRDRFITISDVYEVARGTDVIGHEHPDIY